MKTFVAIPCGDYMPVGFTRSVISMKVNTEMQFTFAQGSLVYDARNQLANYAIDQGFDRMLWLDSDMEFESDLLIKLQNDLETKGCEIVSGLYFSRKLPIRAVAYSKVGMDSNGVPCAESLSEWPDDMFEIAACGFGAVLCTVDLMRRVRDKFKLPFSPILGFGEDLSFCLRVHELGEKIWCDPRIKIGHIGQTTYTKDHFMMGMQNER